MKILNRQDHICINATNKDLAWCVNKQQQGLKGCFDHTMSDVDNLDIDYEKVLQNYIDLANAGETEEIKVISENLISDRGFYTDENNVLWLTIGTIADLESELIQEIEYQKNNRGDENEN